MDFGKAALPSNQGKPIPFLIKTSDGKITFDKNAKQRLRTIAKPIVDVIAVGGPFRKGKSFLANYIKNAMKKREAENDLRGFPVNPGTKGVTMGIWCWIGDHPKDKNAAVLILDTEGIYCPGADKQVEHYILTLAVLLSSVFIYNVNSDIDETAVERLRLLAQLAGKIENKRHVVENSEPPGNLPVSQSPDLLITVRNFTLGLDKSQSADQYLEGTIAGDDMKSFRSSFPIRKCFLLKTPLADEEKMKRLDKVFLEDLDAGFTSEADRLADYLIERYSNRKYPGLTMNGEVFANLVEQYLGMVLDGSIDIQSALEAALELTNQRIAEEVLEGVNTSMVKVLENVMPEVELSQICEKTKAEALVSFQTRAYHSNANFQSIKAKLKKDLDKRGIDFIKDNRDKAADGYKKMLNDLFMPINSKLEDNTYSKVDGYAEFKTDTDKLMEDYFDSPEVGPGKDWIWKVFHDVKIKVQGHVICDADKALTESQKLEEQSKCFEEGLRDSVRLDALAVLKELNQLAETAFAKDSSATNMSAFLRLLGIGGGGMGIAAALPVVGLVAMAAPVAFGLAAGGAAAGIGSAVGQYCEKKDVEKARYQIIVQFDQATRSLSASLSTHCKHFPDAFDKIKTFAQAQCFLKNFFLLFKVNLKAKFKEPRGRTTIMERKAWQLVEELERYKKSCEINSDKFEKSIVYTCYYANLLRLLTEDHLEARSSCDLDQAYKGAIEELLNNYSLSNAKEIRAEVKQRTEEEEARKRKLDLNGEDESTAAIVVKPGVAAGVGNAILNIGDDVLQVGAKATKGLGIFGIVFGALGIAVDTVGLLQLLVKSNQLGDFLIAAIYCFDKIVGKLAARPASLNKQGAK